MAGKTDLFSGKGMCVETCPHNGKLNIILQGGKMAACPAIRGGQHRCSSLKNGIQNCPFVKSKRLLYPELV
jgi:hypothetical protein